MIDTFQISKTFARPPDKSEFEKNGWKSLRDAHTGEPTALCFNSAKGEPRLTLSRNRNDYWIIRAEVSFGSWLFGSNLNLPNEDEFQIGLDLLSEYVKSKSGIVFDAHTQRVSRVDFTRDFQVGENAVIPIIAKFAKFKLPRYERVCFGDTSVYFKNGGKERTKEFLIYSKYHERLANSKDRSEQMAAKGLIRFEISYRKSAVNRLAKSLKLPSHQANHILTKETSDRIIKAAMKQLHFDSLFTSEIPNFKKLSEICDSGSIFSRVGFLYLRDKFGEDLAKQPFINVSPKTLKRYSDDCNKAGILTLE
ncbi:hypothetical protein BH10ACI1_BH10ACI1_18930 [soil metagenome]